MPAHEDDSTCSKQISTEETPDTDKFLAHVHKSDHESMLRNLTQWAQQLERRALRAEGSVTSLHQKACETDWELSLTKKALLIYGCERNEARGMLADVSERARSKLGLSALLADIDTQIDKWKHEVRPYESWNFSYEPP